MRTFLLNKLCRDKTVDRLHAGGCHAVWRTLSDDEFITHLQEKLREEVDELQAAQSRQEVLAECIDVYDVLHCLKGLDQKEYSQLYELIDAFTAVYGMSADEIAAATVAKHEERGGFKGRLYVERVRCPENHFFTAYCLASPEKYPEVRND